MGVGGQRHAPAALYPRERIPGTHWIGSRVDIRAGLDTEVRGKILFLCRGSNPGRPLCSQTLYCLSYPSYLYYRTKGFITGPYAEKMSSVYTLLSYFLEIHFNIILLPVRRVF
jgi:hypothetical protein